MIKKRYRNLIFLLLLISTPISVKAGTVQFSLCFGDNGAYSILYDDKESVEVSKDKINYEDVLNGHLPYPSGISESDKKKYSFQVTGLSSKCYTEGTEIKYCPSDNETQYIKIMNNYLANGSTTDKIVMNFNENTGNFNINIKDSYNDKLYVRYLSYGRASNAVAGLNASNFNGQFLTRLSGYYTISSVPANADVTLEFYEKSNGPCSGTYIGYISFKTPDSFDYKIDNPAITNADYYGCTEVKNYIPTGMTDTSDLDKFNTMKKTYINECYNTNKINYGTKANLKSTISEKIGKLKLMFGNYTSTVNPESLVCNQSHEKTKLTYASSGSYWAMTCTETYTAQGDAAKLVKAGGGFNYETNYSVTRTCTITQIGQPVKLPKCNYSISHLCSWPERAGTKTGNDAGPNEDFDNCVSICDGGKYSQNCINKCYQSVYKKSRDLSFTNKFLTDIDKSKTKFTALVDSKQFTSWNTNQSCTTDHNRPGYQVFYSYNGVNDSACYSANYCAIYGGECTFYTTKTPDVCSDYPDSDYANALASSEAELRSLIAKQEEIIPSGEYAYRITDSYLKTEKNQPYVYTVNSKDNPNVNVTSTEQVISSSSTTKQLGASGGKSIGYNESLTKKANIKVQLPLSYVNKVNGNVVYTNSDSTKAFSVNHIKNRFDSVVDFNQLKYYTKNGDNKYYTSIWSSNINVIVANDKAELIRAGDYNISVSSSNVGGGSFNSDISCYYGVYNNFYDECTGKQCGIQYIYRPINLTDVFPNDRNPRWNWTGTLNSSSHASNGAAKYADNTYLNYNIDPTTLVEEIENKGNSIYNVQNDPSEVDYEFVLTKDNLKNIRAYNKSVMDYNGDGYRNYMDYNMSCYKDASGREICTSKFLDNITENSGTASTANFITYSVGNYTIDARKNLAGCNNSKSGQCYNIGK